MIPAKSRFRSVTVTGFNRGNTIVKQTASSPYSKYESRVRTHDHPGWELNPGKRHLAGVMKKAKYHTAVIEMFINDF